MRPSGRGSPVPGAIGLGADGAADPTGGGAAEAIGGGAEATGGAGAIGADIGGGDSRLGAARGPNRDGGSVVPSIVAILPCEGAGILSRADAFTSLPEPGVGEAGAGAACGFTSGNDGAASILATLPSIRAGACLPLGAISTDGGAAAVGGFGKSCGGAGGSRPLASILGGSGSDVRTSCIVFRAADCSHRNRPATAVKPAMPPAASHRGANRLERKATNAKRPRWAATNVTNQSGGTSTPTACSP